MKHFRRWVTRQESIWEERILHVWSYGWQPTMPFNRREISHGDSQYAVIFIWTVSDAPTDYLCLFNLPGTHLRIRGCQSIS